MADRPPPSGATRVAAVIGHPVRHSLSPAIHNAAFAAAGLDWVYGAFDVAPGQGRAAVAAMRALGIGGMSVTMPHKDDVAEAVDRLSPQAARLGAVNTVVWEGAQLVGHNTDGAGLVDSLVAETSSSVAGLRCVVLGAGGSARSVCLALAEAGAADVAVANRTPARAALAAALADSVGRVVEVSSSADFAAADLIVNATSVGMAGTDTEGETPFDISVVRSGQIVVDLVYHPVQTPLLAGARRRGAIAVTGVGMLIHQAAHQFSLWTGAPAPVEAMENAALEALAAGGPTGG